MKMNQYIEYSEEVSDALQNKRPVVAIETGIKLPCKMDSVTEVANAYCIKNELKIGTGMILMNHVSEKYDYR